MVELILNMEKFVVDYDSIDDVLTIYDSEKQVQETIEFAEFINLDLDNSENVVGIEIFEASKFLSNCNPQITFQFLKNLKSARLEYKEHRNVWFMVVVLTNNQNIVIRQSMPPIMKSSYLSPLLVKN